jgi:hypothetical protein
MKRLMAILSCLAAVAWISGALANSGASPARARMAAAAEALLDSMDDAMRERMQFAFDGSQRRDWHYIPRERHGVNLGELDGLQARAAHELLRSALSDGGYLKAHGVMLLEEILHEALPEEQRRRGARDPGLYSLAIYGDPDPVEPWAWRIEGHHMSLNFTSVGSELLIPTPFFMGAEPAEAKEGKRAGLRVLANEIDLARELLASLDEKQREVAILSAEAPGDILLGPGRDEGLESAQGLCAADMRPQQRALLIALIGVYLGNWRQDVAAREWRRIESAGIDGVRFAWAGAEDLASRHYYRVHGPHFVIEYDSVRPHGNHVHSIWRDLENDFGGDLLRAHLERDHSDR